MDSYFYVWLLINIKINVLGDKWLYLVVYNY